MDVDKQILKYEPDIKRSAYWYFSLWPRERHYNVNELVQAGRLAVWNVFEKHPEKINQLSYVRAAIRYSMLGEIKKSVPKIKEVHLVRRFEDDEVPLIDLLPVYDGHNDRLRDLDEICHYISQNFSEREADSLKTLVEKSDVSFDLNLSKPPTTELKQKVGLVTKMDLDDEEMLVYANVLLGALDRFPRDYVINGKERAKKYIKFMLEQTGISPEQFALSHDRRQTLEGFELDSFYQKVYHNRMPELFAHIFPDLEPHQIRGRGRWKGRDGLLNGYNAIDWVRRKTGKQPGNLRFVDFKGFQVDGFFREWINGDWRVAVEFRYPGTYPDLQNEVIKLWEIFRDNRQDYIQKNGGKNQRSSP